MDLLTHSLLTYLYLSLIKAGSSILFIFVNPNGALVYRQTYIGTSKYERDFLKALIIIFCFFRNISIKNFKKREKA